MAVKKKNKSAEADFPFYIKRFWQIFGIGFGVVVLIFLLASWGALGHMPSFNDLENPESNLATEIISSDGETIGKFYNENRTSVTYDDLPKHLVDALVATEDERFYDHSGIDARSTARAFTSFGGSGGGSTLSQQLVEKYGRNFEEKNLRRVLQFGGQCLKKKSRF